MPLPLRGWGLFAGVIHLVSTMSTISAFGSCYDVPCSNGMTEDYDDRLMTDDQWAASKAQIEGRIAAPISPEHKADLAYLQSYIRGAMASIDARLLMPEMLADAEVEVLYLWAMYTAQVLTRLRQLDLDMIPDEF
jgi:hypothetical protein